MVDVDKVLETLSVNCKVEDGSVKTSEAELPVSEEILLDNTRGDVQTASTYAQKIAYSGAGESYCVTGDTTARMTEDVALGDDPDSNAFGGTSEIPLLSPKVLCRGAGHVKVCGACYHRDDRFGRSCRCRRECAVLDGVWGPTVCSAECEPNKLEHEEKIENDQTTQISVSTDFTMGDETSTSIGSCMSVEMTGHRRHNDKPKTGRVWSSRVRT